MCKGLIVTHGRLQIRQPVSHAIQRGVVVVLMKDELILSEVGYVPPLIARKSHENGGVVLDALPPRLLQ